MDKNSSILYYSSNLGRALTLLASSSDVRLLRFQLRLRMTAQVKRLQSLKNSTVSSSKSAENCGKHPEKTPEEIKDILKHWKIIPDVIPKSAPGIVKVAYGEKIVNFGNNLTKTETRNPPTYVHWETEPECFYCLIMADPDFPDASFKSRQWQHWKVGNIPGTDLEKGQSMSDYIGVQAPQGTGMHRYVFVVYKRLSGQMKFDEFQLINFPTDDLRANFSTAEFAEQYNLGDPLAVNFFMSQWDDYPEFRGAIPEPNF